MKRKCMRALHAKKKKKVLILSWCMKTTCESDEVKIYSLIPAIKYHNLGFWSIPLNENTIRVLSVHKSIFPDFSYESRKNVNQQQGLMLIKHADIVKKKKEEEEDH